LNHCLSWRSYAFKGLIPRLSFYDILEVTPAATAAEIRASYLKLAREYPDRVPEYWTKLRADAEDEIKDINYALGKWQPECRFSRFDLH